MGEGADDVGAVSGSGRSPFTEAEGDRTSRRPRPVPGVRTSAQDASADTPGDFMSAALDTLGLTRRRRLGRLESRSGAGVQAVRTVDGRDAFLKAASAAPGPEVVAAARRELRFYLDVAPTAPVRTPKLLGHLDTDEGVALLLEAAGEAHEPGAWTAGMWADLGGELAALHNMPSPPASDWNRPDALGEALADPHLEQINAFWATVLPRLPELLCRRAELKEQMTALPPVFVHGDCHTGNLVRSGGTVVFCDWQAAGTGRPASDLAFLSVRSTPAGTTVPQALLDAYMDCRPGERQTWEHALLAEELAAFLLLWPAFAEFNSPLGIARVRRRTVELAERWLGA